MSLKAYAALPNHPDIKAAQKVLIAVLNRQSLNPGGAARLR